MKNKLLQRLKIANIYWFSITFPVIVFALLLDSRVSLDNYFDIFIGVVFSGGYLFFYCFVIAFFLFDLFLNKRKK